TRTLAARQRARGFPSGPRSGERGKNLRRTARRGALRLRRGWTRRFGRDTEQSGDKTVSQRRRQAGTPRAVERAAGQPERRRLGHAIEAGTADRPGPGSPLGWRVLVSGQRGAGIGSVRTGDANLDSLAGRRDDDRGGPRRRARD